MISQTAEYALRAAVCLAAAPERPQTTPQIARLSQVPAGYLAKVLGALARAGIVIAKRGQGGGFLLARSPRELNVLDIVQAVDPIARIDRCPLGLAEHRDALCPLHQRIDAAYGVIEAAFAATTLDLLLDHPRGERPLCVPRGHDPEVAGDPRAAPRPYGA